MHLRWESARLACKKLWVQWWSTPLVPDLGAEPKDRSLRSSSATKWVWNQLGHMRLLYYINEAYLLLNELSLSCIFFKLITKYFRNLVGKICTFCFWDKFAKMAHPPTQQNTGVIRFLEFSLPFCDMRCSRFCYLQTSPKAHILLLPTEFTAQQEDSIFRACWQRGTPTPMEGSLGCRHLMCSLFVARQNLEGNPKTRTPLLGKLFVLVWTQWVYLLFLECILLWEMLMMSW